MITPRVANPANLSFRADESAERALVCL